jgi:hypothetical protein
MQSAFLIVELFVSVFLAGMGAVFFIQELSAEGPARLEMMAIAIFFCSVGLAVGSHALRRLSTRRLLLAGAGVYGLAAVGGVLAAVVLGVAAWLAMAGFGLLGSLACVARLRGLA